MNNFSKTGKAYRLFVLLLSLLSILSSCNHKELYYEENAQFRLLKVAFDWSQLSGHEKPEEQARWRGTCPGSIRVLSAGE